MKKYEFMYILFPTLTEEERNATILSVEETFKAAGANILSTDKWGERKLAYPIEKKETGFYVLTTKKTYSFLLRFSAGQRKFLIAHQLFGRRFQFRHHQ